MLTMRGGLYLIHFTSVQCDVGDYLIYSFKRYGGHANGMVCKSLTQVALLPSNNIHALQ